MEELGIRTDGIHALRQMYVTAMEQGLNENDYSAIYDIIFSRDSDKPRPALDRLIAPQST